MNRRPPDTLKIRSSDYAAMFEHVARMGPEEACGLLAGTMSANFYQVEQVIPTTNILHSPERYRIDPVEQLRAFERIEAAGLELVGIYHSHPQGPHHPSETDRAEAYYPEVVYLIWAGLCGGWGCAGFCIQNGQALPVKVDILT